MTATLALIRDTFREAIARKIFWGLFGLSSLMILFFLFVMKIDIVAGATASISLFGFQNHHTQDVDKLVRGIFAVVATFLYSFGNFLAVFASSGLTPSVLEPGRIELLLSKPVSRLHILLGRYTGNLLVVVANTVYLVVGVWLILGWKTGIWNPAFLLAIPTTVFIFAVLLAVVVLVGVLWDSTALSVMITVALMIVSSILAQKDMVVKLMSSEWSRRLWIALYYVLPKVHDLGAITLNAIKDGTFAGWMPIWTSALFGAAALGSALYVFSRRSF
jgi:ABC-type transport system involved in multi-copper enzyme maturation permease subunit